MQYGDEMSNVVMNDEGEYPMLVIGKFHRTWFAQAKLVILALTVTILSSCQSSPSVTGETPVVQANAGLVVIVYTHSAILAIDPNTTRTLWTVSPVLMGTQPAIVSTTSVVYGFGQVSPGIGEGSTATAQSGQPTAAAFALDAHTGQFLWKTPIPSQTPFGVLTVADGLVFVATIGASPTETVALEALTGVVRWRASANDSSHNGQVGALTASATTLVEQKDGLTLAYRAQTGAILWQQSGIFRYPLIDNGALLMDQTCGGFTIIILTGSQECLANLNFSSGAMVWNTSIGETGCFLIFCNTNGSGTFAASSGSVYAAGGQTGTLPNSRGYVEQVIFAVAESSGDSLWKYIIPGTYITYGKKDSPAEPAWYTMLGADANAVYYMSTAHVVTALSIHRRVPLWTHQLPSVMQDIQFSESDGVLYFASTSSGEVAVSASAGTTLWQAGAN